MTSFNLLILLLAITAAGYYFGRHWALKTGKSTNRIQDKVLHSLPSHYGTLVAMFCLLPALMLITVWLACSDAVIIAKAYSLLPADYQAIPEPERSLVTNNIKNIASGSSLNPSEDVALQRAADHYNHLKASSAVWLSLASISLALIGFFIAWRILKPQLWARQKVEFVILALMVLCACISIFTTIGIVFSVLFESIRFFEKVPISEFMFGVNWSPQTAIRSDQVGGSGSFGAIPLFVGTILISFVAMVIAVPLGLMSAIYLAEYATPRFRSTTKPLLEILAGIPTVVYGFFAALTVAPMIRGWGAAIGLDVASESALAAGLVMGIMIIPFVSSLSDDVITAVPQSLRDGSYGLGATKSETIKHVIIPAALPGIMGGILLAVSRAIGETMIVVMAAGLAANLTVNPLEAVTTVTVQIVTLLTGDQEFDSAKTLAAFALGLMLFITTLILNIIALKIVRKYREQYD